MPRAKPTIFRDELEWLLLNVATTPSQARRIILRSEALLSSPASPTPFAVRRGCPHCLDAGRAAFRYSWISKFEIQISDCRVCAYPSAKHEVQWFCVGRPFAGVRYKHVSGIVELWRHKAVRHKPLTTMARKFLRGHADWGHAVINTGGKRATPERINAYLDKLYGEAE